MNVLVLGSRGQLACHLRELLPHARYWGQRERDLADSAATEAAIVEAAPDVIVNAAAYTAVDKAEEDAEMAWRVNAEGAAAAARAAARLDVPLIHVSTDYVFDGTSDRPYRDTDPVRPLNVYGCTKLAGELAVTSICARHRVLRTSWVFSELAGNFATTMLRLGNDRDRLRVVADQRGRPTYAGDLARVIVSLLDDANGSGVGWGTYHLSGGEAVSWYEFAVRILSSAQDAGLVRRKPAIDAIATSDYPTRARRPMNSVLEPSRGLVEVLGFEPDWTAGVAAVLVRIARHRAD